MKDWQRWLLLVAGLVLAFEHPILTFTTSITNLSGEAVSALYGAQLVTVPLGLGLFGFAIELRRPLAWIVVFLIGVPVIFLLGLVGQIALCGLTGSRC